MFDQPKVFTPEEISSFILQKLKEHAETYLKKPVTRAVITVPANFKDSQRQATKDAGRIAGLEVLRIINEPTAAALAFGIRDKYANDAQERNVLVYDFGGGTFDVSVISVENGIFDVKSTNGDTHLGGDDIDLCLVNYFVKEFQEKYKENLGINRRALRRLRMQCEKAKRELSTASNATIDIPLLHNSIDFSSGITRSKFEEICADIFNKTLWYVQEALKDAEIEKDKIEDIILVGGSSRIPKIQQLVREFFNGKEVNVSMNPEEAVALGAAVQAAILDGHDNNFTGALLLLDVTPLSLGVETAGGVMSVIIPRNTQIPTKVTKRYSNEKDNQTKVKIVVYEGERGITEGNNKLGEFILSGIKPQRRGKSHINVTFQVDTNGILYVTAEDVNDAESTKLTIQIEKGRLSEEEIVRMIGQAQLYSRDDEERKATIAARIQLETYCIDAQYNAEHIVSNPDHKTTIVKKCNEVFEWIKNNKMSTKEDFETKKKEMHNELHPILKQYL